MLSKSVKPSPKTIARMTVMKNPIALTSIPGVILGVVLVFGSGIAAVPLAIAAKPLVAAAESKDRPPNIIVFFTDDKG